MRGACFAESALISVRGLVVPAFERESRERGRGSGQVGGGSVERQRDAGGVVVEGGLYSLPPGHYGS